MTIPLLRTKLFIPPPRPDLVPRSRLIGRLDEGLRLGRRLTLISAQAGFGKTTLLSEWAHHLRSPIPDPGLDSGFDPTVDGSPSPVQHRVAWLSLDEGDNDPVRFWSYVVTAVQTVYGEVGRMALAAFQSPQPPPIEVVLVTWINELAAVPAPFCLVLDDYHVVESPPIHEALAFLLDHQPPQMHLGLATRADPPFPLARLRARGQVTELRVADLRFTPGEAAAFLQQVARLDLSAEQIATLEKRTEGWIAGLQLAALSMQGREDLVGFVQAFAGSNRYVLDYLTEEVLQRQDESVQSFLLRTAILERLTGSLCDAVTGRQDGTSMLAALEQANLFLLPLDDKRCWYRYHRLFADLLRARLLEAEPAELPELHRRASAWFEAEGALDEAVQHALAAGDQAAVGRLIEVHGLPMLFRGELITLQRWISALPEERIRASARICVYAAWVNLLTGQVQALADRLQQAERLLAAAPVEDLAGHLAAIRAYATAQQGDIERTVELARHALDLLAEDSLGVRGVVWFILGATSILRGDLAGAEEALLQASTTGQQGGNIHIAVPALNALSGLQAQRGRLHRAQATAQEAIRIASGDADQPLPIAGGAVSALAELAYEWDDLDEALALAQQSLDLNQQWGNSDSLYSCYLTLAQVLQARGDPAGAEEALREAEALSRERSLSPLHKTAWHAVRARIWLAQGKLDAVARWAQDTTFEGPDQLRAAEHLALARARLVLVQPAAALQVLGPLLELTRNLGMTTLAIEALAVEALAHQTLGDSDRALRALDEALSLARREGYVRRFLDQGEALAPLLRVAWSRDVERAYVAELLAAFEERTIDEAEASIRRPTIDDGPAVGHLSFLVEPLSERELEVLDLIAAGLSNREIAEKMIVEVSTVKSHANHIYGKLGVKNRTQAVARARELGLL